MHGHVLVPLLEPVVLLDVVQVVPPDDARLVHLQLGDDTGQDPAADGHLADERALLVDVVAHTGLSWGLEAESRVAHEPGGKCCSVLTPDVENSQELMSLPGLTGLESTLPVQVDGGLLLESPLILIGHPDFCNSGVA